jgi:hypothetical protein
MPDGEYTNATCKVDQHIAINIGDGGTVGRGNGDGRELGSAAWGGGFPSGEQFKALGSGDFGNKFYSGHFLLP